jgi:methyl-accepting chemotaxis protein
MKISSKLYIGFGLVVTIAVIVQAILIINLTTVKSSLEEFNTVESRLQELGNEMRYYDALLTSTVRAIMLEPGNQALRSRYDETGASLDAAIQEASALAPAEEDRQLFAELATINTQIVEIERDIIANPSSEEASNLYTGSYIALEEQYSQIIDTFYEREHLNFVEGQAAIQNNLTLVQTISIGLAIGLSFLALAIAIFLSRNISKALTVLMEGASAVSNGDLSKRVLVSNKDELGTLADIFNQMTENL